MNEEEYQESLLKHKAKQTKISTKEVLELVFIHISKGILYGLIALYLLSEFLFVGRFKEFMDEITLWNMISSHLYILLIAVAVLECVHNFLNGIRMKAVKLKKPKWLRRKKK